MKTTSIKALAIASIAASLVLPLSTFAAVNLYGNTDVSVGVGSSTKVGVNAGMSASSSSAANRGSNVNATAASNASATGTMQANDNAAISIGHVFNIGRTDLDTNAGAEVTSATNVSSDADVQSYSHSVIKNDVNVTAVSADENTVSVTYKEPAKFLGFINTTLSVTAKSDVDGNVTISYPWYAFLIAKPNDAALHASAQAQAHAAAQSAVVQANATTTMTARLQAALISALHEAFQSNVSADASANANANANSGY